MPLNPVEVVGGIAIGEGVGGAVQAVVEPQLQKLKNAQWADHADVPPDVMALADGVAHGHLAFEPALAVAKLSGFGEPAFRALVTVARSGPGTGLAFELWRRGKLGETAFRRALKRTGMEDEWIDALVEVKQRILSPQELAVMVQRGVVPDPGYLPVGPPSGRGKVPPMPVANIDTEAEAAGSGYDHERMAALTRIIGLPASPDLAARATFRGIIERIDFDRAVAEGNTRNEWRDAIFEAFREILTAHEYAELQLRGYLTREQRLAGTAKHGMSEADSDHLYDVLGRSINVHDIERGFARGGTYNGPIDGIPEAYLRALQRGNLRPEYYNLAYANRYSYPSAFVLRALAENGDLTRDETHQILLEIGWKPDLAAKVSTRWAGGAGATGDPNVKKAQVQLWSQAHRSFVAGEAQAGETQEALTMIGVPAAAQQEVLGLWLTEQAFTRKQLTAAQVKKAWSNAVTNPRTGATWTREDAITRLLQLGYTLADASTFLDE